ncbi:MAG: SMP-30/gluconolactonase/LRE family protein [Deltaproteobacteria bacterium]|nr:SMP-30/gluconolactonase/LRE family protein [Deltaproteobacteria bacterium]
MRRLLCLIGFLLLVPIFTSCSSSEEGVDGGAGRDGGSSACSDESVGKPCTEGVGECESVGKFVCDEDTGEVSCTAKAGKPSDEICDGKDNDCNGEADEEWTDIGKACQDGVGECLQAGFMACTADGKGTSCTARALPPDDEVCDGRDNNCDGKTDEDWPEIGKTCTSGIGECAREGKSICSPGGAGTVCDAMSGEPSPEICDGKDNNCDGENDEIFADLGKPCTAGKGECENTGRYFCAEDGKGTMCDAEPKPISAEVCDGKDNNCNGFVDEGAPDCAVVIAGNGKAPVTTGKGLSETYFTWPAGIAYDPARDEMYVSDSFANVILRLTYDPVDRVWNSTVLSGSGFRGDAVGAAPGDAEFSQPTGVAFAGGALLFVADTGNHSIKLVDTTTGETFLVAGSGKPGKDDGDGAASSFDTPQALSVGPDGTVFVADTGNHCIRAITFDALTAEATVSTFAGLCGTPGSANAANPPDARFSGPAGIAVDADGRVFVADAGNAKIRVIDAQDGVSDYVAIPQSALRSLAVDEFGYLFVTDAAGSLRQISATKAITTLIGGLFDPLGLAIGKGSSAYVAEQGAGVIRKVNLSNGSSALAAGTGVSPPGEGDLNLPLAFPTGVAVDETDDTVFIADTVAHRLKLLENWKLKNIGGDGTASSEDGLFDLPSRVLYSGGDLVVSDSRAHCVKKVKLNSTTGEWKTSALVGKCGSSGNADGAAAAARLSSPTGLAAGEGGAILIADTGNHCVRAFDGTDVKVFSGKCGTAGLKNGAASGVLYRAPEGIACDAGSKTCWVADTGNHVIREIAADGTVTPFSGINSNPGGGGPGGYVDGNSAVAKFNEPSAIALGKDGGLLTLYVADRGNHGVRTLNDAGASATVLGKTICGHASGKKADTELCLPSDVFVTAAGTLYVSDSGNNRIVAVY